jgi:CMP-N,N'-diacetyllegionaminic acid synthase
MITAVVAVRAGSQRVPNKNSRLFGDTNLLRLKLDILKQVSNIDRIIVNTDSNYMLDIAQECGVEAFRRDSYYASSAVSNSEFHKHIAEVTDSNIIMLAPVCSPFVTVKTHERAIDQFKQSNNDSLTSVSSVKNHLLLNGSPINYTFDNVKNSQDLPDIVKLTYGITLVDRKLMLSERRVVGWRPKFIHLNEWESVDIDTEFDFQIAEQIYKNKLYEDFNNDISV